MKNPFPPSVHRIAVPAPAGVPGRDALERSLALLASFGLEVCLGAHVFAESEETYFASSRENRAADFNVFLRDPAVDLILCARGGYGSMQILPLIDWETLRRRNLPVVGFSDITALHLAMLERGAGIPVASQMAARLAAALEDASTADGMERALRLAFHPGGTAFRKLAALVPVGTARDVAGSVVCANLTMLSAMAGTPFLPGFRDRIVILEDIGEAPRKVDRALVQLELSGILAEASCVIFGDFTDCGTQDEMLRVFRRFAAATGLSVYAGLAFGHALPSLSFVCGEEAEIRSSALYCRS